MAARFLVLAVIQGIIFQTVYSQCVNRVPNCGPCSSNMVETIIPNLYREPGLPLLPGPVYPGPLCPGPLYPGAVIPEVGYAPAIIQDSSVANNLANALQLLVVSNLLSTTLPGPCEVPAYPYDYPYLPAYNYAY